MFQVSWFEQEKESPHFYGQQRESLEKLWIRIWWFPPEVLNSTSCPVNPSKNPSGARSQLLVSPTLVYALTTGSHKSIQTVQRDRARALSEGGVPYMELLACSTNNSSPAAYSQLSKNSSFLGPVTRGHLLLDPGCS